MWRTRLFDALVQGATWIAGSVLILSIVAVFYYLFTESRYAFERTFPVGFRIALQPPNSEYKDDLSMDPTASLLATHREGTDALDESEEVTRLPSHAELASMQPLVTATTQAREPHQLDPQALFRDCLRSPKRADQGERFLLLAFAMPSYSGKTMELTWEPDVSFDPAFCPYELRLRLVRIPEGVSIRPIVIDLKQQPRGRITLPVWEAHSQADWLNGYLFELEIKPVTSNTWATLAEFFKPDWAPTILYARFGMLPLLLATLLITLLSMGFAVPLGLAAAVYLSEQASPRVREWFKPILEILAAIPTVVLGYFGVMLVAPWVQQTVASAFQLTSGRGLLATALIMTVFILPTIISLSEDALRAVPSSLRDGAEALGLTFAERVRLVVLPAARSGILAALLLATARVMGETMIVWILSGGTPTMPDFSSLTAALGTLVKPVRGIPDTIAIEMGNVEFESPHYGHLFLLGLTLFVLTLAINLIGFMYRKRAQVSL
ncbi:MAG: phosphate ABC transporter permease subunit PstC [Armatimonadota bacterium]